MIFRVKRRSLETANKVSCIPDCKLEKCTLYKDDILIFIDSVKLENSLFSEEDYRIYYSLSRRKKVLLYKGDHMRKRGRALQKL